MPLAIETFTENVRHFCLWVESRTHDVKTARELLLALMQGIPHLVVPKAQGEEFEYGRRGYEEGWRVDQKRFYDFPFQYYQEMYSPCDLGDDLPVTGDVHDDFADIYGELWHGLQALDRGDVNYAVNHWRESYFQHWGHHAASAICAIDDYYRKSKNGEPEDTANPTPPRG